MNIATRKGYGKKFIYKDLSDVYKIYDQFYNADSVLGLEDFFWFESESNLIYHGYKDSDNNLVSSKALYKRFTIREDSDLDLLNAYGFPYQFRDKNEVYPFGLIFKDSDNEVPLAFIVYDSEGYHVWRKRAGTKGSQKEHYNVGGYWYDPSRIKNLRVSPKVLNVLNGDFNPFLFDGNSNEVYVRIENRTLQEDSERLIHHGVWEGYRPSLMYLQDEHGTNIPLISYDSETIISGQTTITTIDDCNGVTYTDFFSSDSEIFFHVNENMGPEDVLKFKYVTEFTDSEAFASPSFTADSEDSIVPILTADDSRVVTDFTAGNYHPDNPPWKVFSDSENDGFKASVGVQSGYIGWQNGFAFDGTLYNLKSVIVKNTPATLDNARPYTFDIEAQAWDSDGWEVIHSVVASTQYVHNIPFTMSKSYRGFRVKIHSCQPTFDPLVDALEIKQIIFNAELRNFNAGVAHKDSGWFITNAETDYFITLGDNDLTASGLLIGGGAGGGFTSFEVSGGGGGGGYCRVDSITLRANRTYRLRIGSGGASNTGGNATILEDVTSSKVIVRANGGSAGASINTPSGTAAGGAGGTVDVFPDADNLLVWVDSDGGDGGTFSNSVESPGEWGTQAEVKFYSSLYNTSAISNYDLCSGGGSGAGLANDGSGDLVNAGAFNNGPSAGNGHGGPSISSPPTNGAVNRGGGGGGGGVYFTDRFYSTEFGGSGGSGYAYLIFK